MELTMLDVGQGDASLLVAPDGSTALIDTGGLGGYSASTRLDTGEDIVAPYLWKRGIQRIDTLILSHLDFDHAGGAPAILRIFRPKTLMLAKQNADHPLLDRVLAVARAAGVECITRRAEDTGNRAESTGELCTPVPTKRPVNRMTGAPMRFAGASCTVRGHVCSVHGRHP